MRGWDVPRWSDRRSVLVASAAILLVTAVFRLWLHLTNPTIAALIYLLIVLLTATVSRLRAAIVTCVIADVFLNYFFMPPFGAFTIADPQNGVALFVFVAVSVVASSLSSALRDRAVERAQFLEERKTAELARQSAELKSTLLASISHDLRTPLTTIRVAASNLRASWLADHERREQSDLILTEVERLHRLFQNILEMARIDAGAISPHARWVHPSEIVEAARAQVEPALRQHHLDLHVESDALVHVDPLLTAAALAHVLENAAQYSPAALPISVGVGISPADLVITVRDRGPGLAVDDLPHVFERFYRGAESQRRKAGTGMGLSIARGMLAAERGRIWAENCIDGGAQFSIVIPAERTVASPLEQTS